MVRERHSSLCALRSTKREETEAHTAAKTADVTRQEQVCVWLRYHFRHGNRNKNNLVRRTFSEGCKFSLARDKNATIPLEK